MQVIIDGNNLLFAAHAADPERPVSRLTLCQILGRWGALRKSAVVVVFDGDEPSGGLATQMASTPVQVQFSGREAKADDVIAELIHMHSAPRRLWVVSSDKEVARAARRRAAEALRSDQYWDRVQHDLSKPKSTPNEPAGKREGLSPAETDAWLRDLGLG